MKIGVLALQGDVHEHLRALEQADATALEVRRSDELAAVDALVLPGGESTTIGKLLARFGLLEQLKERASAGMPLYGTCAGLILMATKVAGEHDAPHRLGLMDVTVRRNGYGRQVDSFETDIEVAGLDGPLRAVFIRAPVIEEVGDEVSVLATCEGRPVVVRQGHLLASAFHPEIAGDVRLHSLFVAMAKERTNGSGG